MPKIPTYTVQGRPTAEIGGVKTNLQISPTAGPAASLLPAINQLTDYSIKKRDTAEKVEAAKKVFEIKGELDKYIQAEKENINDENAINNFQKKYKDYINQKLSGITNNRVKKRIQQNLDLEYSEYVYNIKKNSYTALEKESIKVVNDEINSLSGRNASTDNPILKVKYKTEAKNKITQFAKDFGLPENVLNKKLEAVDRQFFLSDVNQFVGLENGAEQINKLDTALKGTSFLNDKDFGDGIYNSYLKKISDITIKGDANSNYDRALELTEELEKFERSNGYKVNSGELSIKIDSLKEKILTEKIQHDGLIQKQGDNKLFFNYSKDLGKALTQSIADPFAQPEIQDRLASAEIESEYNETIKQYLLNNQDATLEDKKEFARSLVYSLKNIYENRKIQQVNMINMDKNTFDIQYEYQQVINDMKLLSENKLNLEKVKQYKTLAKLNGYTIKVNGETEGDLKAFINEYLPSLQSQIKTTLGQ